MDKDICSFIKRPKNVSWILIFVVMPLSFEIQRWQIVSNYNFNWKKLPLCYGIYVALKKFIFDVWITSEDRLKSQTEAISLVTLIRWTFHESTFLKLIQRKARRHTRQSTAVLSAIIEIQEVILCLIWPQGHACGAY